MRSECLLPPPCPSCPRHAPPAPAVPLLHPLCVAAWLPRCSPACWWHPGCPPWRRTPTCARSSTRTARSGTRGRWACRSKAVLVAVQALGPGCPGGGQGNKVTRDEKGKGRFVNWPQHCSNTHQHAQEAGPCCGVVWVTDASPQCHPETRVQSPCADR